MDTGSSRTLIRRDLVPREKLLEGRAITICCAHGDTVLYPLAKVNLEVSGKQIEVEAAVAERLPMGALLGTDVPQLKSLLMHQAAEEDAVVDAMVMTRQGAKIQEREMAEKCHKQEECGVPLLPMNEKEEMDETNAREKADETEETDEIEKADETEEREETEEKEKADETDEINERESR